MGRWTLLLVESQVMLFRLGVDLPEDPFADADAGANRGAKGVLMCHQKCFYSMRSQGTRGISGINQGVSDM